MPLRGKRPLNFREIFMTLCASETTWKNVSEKIHVHTISSVGHMRYIIVHIKTITFPGILFDVLSYKQTKQSRHVIYINEITICRH